MDTIILSKVFCVVSTIVVQKITSKFVAKEMFVRDTGPKAKVKISYLGDNFNKWFLLGHGKIEDPTSEQILCYAELSRTSVDFLIITELGEAKAETTLSEMFSLMEKQKNGEFGPLLNDGNINIFYIKDIVGVLRAVSVFWDGDGWDVDASSVSESDEQSDGFQVFFRNSDLKSPEPVLAAN